VLPEALVLFSCYHSYGCPQTSSLYFSQNPEVKKYIDRQEQKIEVFAGPILVDFVGPALYVVAGGTGTVKINKYFSLQINKQGGTLTFRLTL
jgi:hypothetical protein